MNEQQHLAIIKQIQQEYRYYKSIESLFELDQWSLLPVKGGAYRQQMAAYIAEQKRQLFFKDQAHAAAKFFKDIPLNQIENLAKRGLIRTFLKQYRIAVNSNQQLEQQYRLIKADVVTNWLLAREKNDYRIFQPWLKQVFDLKKQMAQAINPDQDPFETLIGLTDDGLSCEQISREFSKIKQGLTELLAYLGQSPIKPAYSLPNHQENIKEMMAFAERLAIEAGYDLQKGAFNQRVVHGFTSFMGPNDARISSPCRGSLSIIFTYLHEAGHAMYATGANAEICEANLWGGIEGSFQEACARLYENMIGRSKAYWQHYYPQLQKICPYLNKLDLDDFYRQLNLVKPGLRRIEADEVHYSLHAILRFELENDYMQGKIKAADLAAAWNQKYHQYIGISPTNDQEGILQDMHWAGDYIGYFQSYALGNLYAGQFWQLINQDLPNLNLQLAQGNLKPLEEWLTANIYQYGAALTAPEMAKKLSGSTLDATPYLDYLNQKYRALY